MFPILYESQYVSLQTLWIFVALALISCSYLAVQRLKRARVNFTLFITHSTSFFLSALIVSRIFYFFLHPDIYVPGFDLRSLKNFFSIWDQGFSFWGAFIGFFAALLGRLKRSEENVGKWLDALSVPILIGMAIGSLGTFLGGYSYGRPTELFLGVRYEVASVKYTVPVHPVQLYTIVFLGVLVLSKRWLKKRTGFFEKEGNATLYYSTFLSLGLFILEFFRGDDTLLIRGFRLPSLCFALFFIISARFLLKRYRSYKHPSDESLQTL